jgi:hypothetical protein
MAHIVLHRQCYWPPFPYSGDDFDLRALVTSIQMVGFGQRQDTLDMSNVVS